MTNNPTIDGVSRELLTHAFNAVNYLSLRADDIGSSNVPIAEALRALLDAPAVERQTTKCGQCGSTSADICNQNGCGFLESGNGEPEVTALQSIIAQLEDKLNKAIDLDFQRRETIASLEGKVQELESGMSEPAYYRIHTPRVMDSGEVLEWWPTLVLYKKEDLAEIVGPYKVVEELFTAPPAPVAVELPDRKKEYATENQHAYLRGWNACLDATAALNTVHVGELDPAQRLAMARGDSFIAEISGDWGTGWTFIDANKTGEGQGVCYAFPPGLTITGKWL